MHMALVLEQVWRHLHNGTGKDERGRWSSTEGASADGPRLRLHDSMNAGRWDGRCPVTRATYSHTHLFQKGSLVQAVAHNDNIVNDKTRWNKTRLRKIPIELFSAKDRRCRCRHPNFLRVLVYRFLQVF